jgi:hypothetical protein
MYCQYKNEMDTVLYRTHVQVQSIRTSISDSSIQLADLAACDTTYQPEMY